MEQGLLLKTAPDCDTLRDVGSAVCLRVRENASWRQKYKDLEQEHCFSLAAIEFSMKFDPHGS